MAAIVYFKNITYYSLGLISMDFLLSNVFMLRLVSECDEEHTYTPAALLSSMHVAAQRADRYSGINIPY